MDTSKITIRPFIPINEQLGNQERKEPYAILSFGNISVELDYTIIRRIRLDVHNYLCCKTKSIFSAAIEEIAKEMEFIMYGTLPEHHRDTNTEYVNNFAFNPLHEDNEEIICKGAGD